MPTLSLAMIVKDEEKNLGRCLQSVQGCFDEIVIVDTGSRDRTKEIAQSFGCVIYDFEWIDDFAAARNFAFSKATGDYVMWLDADDVLKAENRKRLQDLRFQLDSADAYAMRYDTARDEFGNTTSFFNRIRIVRNNGEAKWDAPIHEALVVPEKWKRGLANIIVTHDPGPEDIAHDPGRNIRLLRKAIEVRPNDLRLKYFLARDLSLTKEGAEEAIARFEEYVNLDKDGQNRVNAWLLLGICYWRAGNGDKGIECCLKGIQLDPRWAEFYVTIGQIYYDRKDWKKAAHWFEGATRCSVPDSWGNILYDNYTWVPWDNLCVVYWQLGERQKSYEANEKALSYRPKDKRLIANREVMRDVMFSGRTDENPVRLNIGAPRSIPTYRTCYPLSTPGVDEAFDINKIPYRDSTVHAILCDRSLENLSGQEARDTFQEWARVLRHNGELVLTVTDLDACCESFLREEDRDPIGQENVGPKEFFRHAIYGVSKSGLTPSEKRTSFTREEVRRLLEKNGFEISSITNCQLDFVPSIEVRAYQNKKPLNVSWVIASGNVDDRPTRIRRLLIHRYLDLKGIESRIFEKDKWAGIEGQLFSALKRSSVVVLTEAGEFEEKLAGQLRRSGIPVIFDLSAELYNSERMRNAEALDRLIGSASLSTFASPGIESRYQDLHRTCFIPDSYELSVEPVSHSYTCPKGKKLRAVWCGPRTDINNLDPLRPVIADLGMELVVVDDRQGSWLKDLCEGDVAVFPEPQWTGDSDAKSNFWIVQCQSLGIPVLSSPTPSSRITLDHGKTGFLCETMEDWRKYLTSLKENSSIRERIGRAAKVEVRKNYAIDQVADKLIDVFESLSKEVAAPPRVDIIIPTWNNPKQLKTCVENLRKNTFWPHNIIVVHCGDDETQEWLKKQQDIVSWKSPIQLTFFSSVNAGIRLGKEKYVLLLTEDTIVSSGWMESLMHEALKPDVGVVGPFLNSEKEPILMISRKAIDNVGLFDEEARIGSEAVDYFQRLKSQGFRILQTYDASISHGAPGKISEPSGITHPQEEKRPSLQDAR